jgi:spore coat protein A
MLTRRELLEGGVFTVAGLVAASCSGRITGLEGPISQTLAKYVDRLVIPNVLAPVETVKGVVYYELTMRQFRQRLHRDLPPTTLWGYNGTYPGPTIVALRNQPARVRWANALPTEHLLPVDATIHGAKPPNPAVRTVVHLHGAYVLPNSDGYPGSWFTSGDFADYDYPNTQLATTLWYHDHALGITRLNIYAGLAGLYIVRDPAEDGLQLPSGPFDIPLLIQDRSFNRGGSLFYPDKGDTHPQWVPEFFGDVALVNGKVWPYLDVEARRYRLRLVNGSNARFYRLALDVGMPFYQIGSDGGLLSAPVTLKRILLAPAERADVIIDFSGLGGRRVVLTNDAPAPFPDGDGVVIPEIMQFRVVLPLSDVPNHPLPAVLSTVAPTFPSSAVRVRDLTLDERVDEHDKPIVMLLNELHFEDPVTETPRLNTIEIWRFINRTNDTHPIHVHLVQFRVLDRTPFDAKRYDNYKQSGYLRPIESYFTGPAVPPDPNEAGWKDTVRVNPGQITRIIAHFDIPGRYVWHCHILEHEDNDMMRPYEVMVST